MLLGKRVLTGVSGGQFHNPGLIRSLIFVLFVINSSLQTLVPEFLPHIQIFPEAGKMIEEVEEGYRVYLSLFMLLKQNR